jgi:carboxypeptidase C (cathepsin A)
MPAVRVVVSWIPVALAMAATAAAQTPQPAAVSAATNILTSRADDDRIVVTHHQITLGGKPLRYTARAGLLPIRDNETGAPHAYIFFVAYTVDRAPGEPPRPLTFAWNGGPGASSMLVHLVGFGPRSVGADEDLVNRPATGTGLADNQTTWLDQTDLVFVDPVGTGYSRPTRAEYGEEFYNVLGDIASIAEFVRVYRTRFDAWDAPIFLAGESYGVWRAAGVAEALERRGRKVAGVMLISGGIPVGPVVPDEIKAALFVPVRAAAALYHRRLAPDLQADRERTLHEVETWALNEYAPALARNDGLSPDRRAAIVAQLSRFTGVDPGAVDSRTLVLARQQFAEQLLKDRHRVLERFDTRRTTDRAASAGRAALVYRYLRNDLGYATDLVYQGLEESYSPATGARPSSVGSRWDYNQAPAAPEPGGPSGSAPPPPPAPRQGADDGPPGGARPWLRRAMQLDPSLRAFVAAGLYDSLNSCLWNTYLVNHLEPSVRENITAACYEGGHMMYEDADNRVRLREDVRKFIQGALAGR